MKAKASQCTGLNDIDQRLMQVILENQCLSFKEVHGLVNSTDKISYKALNKRFNRLVSMGLLGNNKSKFSLESWVTEEGKRILHNIRCVSNDPICRTHNLLYKCEITRRPDHAFNGFRIIKKLRNAKYPQCAKEYTNGITVQAFDRSITIRVKEIMTFDPFQALHEGFEKVIETIILLENEYKPLRIAYPHFVSNVLQQHHAFRNKALSSLFQSFKIKYRSEVLHVDRSKGIPECEFVGVDAAYRFSKLVEFLEGISRDSFDMERLMEDYTK